MAIHSFLKAERGDPDWQFSPESYYGKEFKIIDANMIEVQSGEAERVVLRQNPTEKDLLAKHLTVTVQSSGTLELIILNEVDANLQQVFLYDIHIKENAIVSLGIFARNGRLNKHIVQIFQESNSQFAAYGIATNTEQGDTEIVTKVILQGTDSQSHQLFLGLAGEASQTVFQSVVIAEEISEGSVIGIENSNLITGVGGRCFSKPETYLNAEYCSSEYASETNTLSLEKIGYLRSRGIDEDTASELIISSFRNQVIELINQENIQEEVREMYVD